MNRLDQQGDVYLTNRKKPFLGVAISRSQLKLAIDFSYEMVYGKGHHRSTRSGGSASRKKGEKFCNTFQGKLAEIVLHDFLKSHGIIVSDLDFSISGEGIWDDFDLIANERKINIKSAVGFSNLLLLEEMDWDEEGRYKPDLEQGKITIYDAFVLLRFKPDIKSCFVSNRLFYSDDNLEKDLVENIVNDKIWTYDFAGYINNRILKKMITEKFVIPRGALLNGTTRMDASNFYCQAGNMAPKEMFIEKLKQAKNGTK